MIPISAIEIPGLTIVKPEPTTVVTMYPKEQPIPVQIPSPAPPQPHAAPVPVPVAVPVPMPMPVPATAAETPAIEAISLPIPIAADPVTPGMDVELVPRSMPKPVYPRAELARGIEGTVLVRLRVNRAGEPVEIRLERSSGSPNLDRAALDAARKWRFQPTMQGGGAVEVEGTVPVRFSILSG